MISISLLSGKKDQNKYIRGKKDDVAFSFSLRSRGTVERGVITDEEREKRKERYIVQNSPAIFSILVQC